MTRSSLRQVSKTVSVFRFLFGHTLPCCWYICSRLLYHIAFWLRMCLADWGHYTLWGCSGWTEVPSIWCGALCPPCRACHASLPFPSPQWPVVVRFGCLSNVHSTNVTGLLGGHGTVLWVPLQVFSYPVISVRMLGTFATCWTND